MASGWSGRGVATVDEARAGYWEAEARQAGLVVIADDGLTTRELVAVRGCDPVLLLPDWWEPDRREGACCWALCELHRRAHGACASRHQIRSAVAVLAETC